MFYNVEFFFEKPYRLFTSETETEYTVTQDQFELYNSGEYIKGEDGNPKRIETQKIEYVPSILPENPKEEVIVEATPPQVSNEQIMTALSEISEAMAKLIGDKND